MLNDRERRTLERIERHFIESDPDFARLFSTTPHRGPSGRMPTVLLVVGLLLMVMGSVMVAVPVALIGVSVSLYALFTAYTRTTDGRRAGFA